ncbi:unnamed protein product, partial [marine sediment metagenome]
MFRVNIPYDIDVNASVVVIRATWKNVGTVVDFSVRNLINGVEAATARADPIGALHNTIVWDYGALVNGSYWFMVQTRMFNGTDVPEDIKITFQLYNATSFADAESNPTYTTNTVVTPVSFAGSDVLVGDHIVINHIWNIPATAGLPEYSTITRSKLSLLSGLYDTAEGIYADPDGFDAWPVPLASVGTYTWETFDGINAGDTVLVTIDSQGGADPAIQVYTWIDDNTDGEVSLDEIGPSPLLDIDDGTTGDGESGSFVAAETGSIAVLVFNFAYVYEPGVSYVVEVDTRVAFDIDSEVGTPDAVSFDTYLLFRNITIDVQFTAWTETDVVWTVNLGAVSFFNFFKPVITVNDAVEVGT